MPLPPAGLPSHPELTRELRLLREKGLIRLRTLDVPGLHAAARAAHRTGATEPDPLAVEQLLRDAVAALGEEEPGRATQYLFGLVQGTVGRRTTDLRERAAGIYGLSVETFRKKPERLLIDRVADEILRLCRHDGITSSDDDTETDAGRSPSRSSGPLATAGAADSPAIRVVRTQLRRALHQVSLQSSLPDDYPHGRYGPFSMPVRQAQDPTSALVVVNMGAVEELRDVDIIVSSENTFLDPDRPFATTLSGQLRNAAAMRDEAGVVIRDVVAVELRDWIATHGSPGRPVEPGVVAPTSSGRLVDHGVRWIYHAAVASPLRGRRGYDVSSSGVRIAVHRCFELARAHRAAAPVPLRSITMPLFGAGDGGLDPTSSFSRLWPAVQAELSMDPSWRIHLTTWTVRETAVVLKGLLRRIDESAG